MDSRSFLYVRSI